MTEQTQSPHDGGPPPIDDRPRPGRHTGDRPALAGPLVFVALMGLLLAGFALMGAAFTDDNGVLFGAGLLLSGAAFMVPLATGHPER